jgi:hypothetical protein
MSESEKKPLTTEEQVKIIQQVLNDPTFFDEEQKYERGILKKPSKDGWKYE